MATDGVRRFLLLATAIAATVVVVTGFADAGGSTPDVVEASFRLEDGSAACGLGPAREIVCRARGTDAAVILAPDGSSHPADVRLHWDDATPVLLAAQSWWNGDARCRLSDVGLTCARAGGAIFVDTGGVGGIL